MSSKEIPEGFKMTELGPLPEEWEVVTLKSHLVLNESGVWGDDLSEGEIGVEVLRSTNIQNSNWVFGDVARRHLTEKQLRRYQLKEGDILITKSSGSKKHIGKAAYVDDSVEDRKVAFSNFMQRIRFDNRTLPKFSFFYIASDRGQKALLRRSTTTTGLRNLTKSDIETLTIPLPPLSIQQKIAAVLSAVQHAREKTEQVIKGARELKKSLMKHLFTYGPVPLNEAESVPLKETEIGMVPEAWEVVRLGDVVKKTEQKDPRKTPEWQFKYIDVSSVNREDLKIVEYKLYKAKDAPSRAKKLVKSNDVIFATVRPTLRRLTLIEEDLNGEICSTAFCVLRAKESFLSSLYVLYAVQRDIFIDELGKIQRGASYPAVTDSDVKNQKIPLPPLPIQQRIASILSAVDRKIEAEQNKKKALDELFKSLLNILMTGKLRINELKSYE